MTPTQPAKGLGGFVGGTDSRISKSRREETERIGICPSDHGRDIVLIA